MNGERQKIRLLLALNGKSLQVHRLSVAGGPTAVAVTAWRRVKMTLACMGLFLSSLCAGAHLFFFVSFFVRSGARFFAPIHISQTLSRAGAVKVGRRAYVATRSHHRQAIP
jgi:hypothetical protein